MPTLKDLISGTSYKDQTFRSKGLDYSVAGEIGRIPQSELSGLYIPIRIVRGELNRPESEANLLREYEERDGLVYLPLLPHIKDERIS